nr:lipoprotein signal peptidase [Neisseria shayeganii]
MHKLRSFHPHLRRISALGAARSLAYLDDMSALAALLCLELHPHLKGFKGLKLKSSAFMTTATHSYTGI